MPVVISPSYVITSTVSGGGRIDGNNPVIGYDNLAPGNITADTEAAGFPASNMGNPSTNLRWVGEVSSPAVDEHVEIATSTEDNQDIDYIAIARHNLGSAGIPVAVDYLDVNASPQSWVELIATVLLPNDEPALFRFPPLPYAALRLRLEPGEEAPTIAVVYCGKLLVLQRRIHAGHTPANYGRVTKVANGKSEAGAFLGRIVLNETKMTGFTMKNITPDWYRTYMDPFLIDAQENPFFFAWRPGDYPREIGFCWLTGDPKPVNTHVNGMLQIELAMGGVA
jgi:hypothetical protein